MKAILAILGAILLIGLSGAVMYDLGDILKGDQMNPSGAPWLKDDAVLYFGTDKDGSLKFNSTSGYLEMVGQETVINVPIDPSEVDQSVFIADDAWQITKIEEVHAVAQNTAFPNTGNLTIRKCTGTEAPSAGDAMHNTTMWLNSTVNTVVTPTLSGVSTNLTLADGNRIALDFNGTTSTLAGGVLTIHMKRV